VSSESIIESGVVVVGAGPVGLFTALTLNERGVDVRILDKYQRSALHSYALALHPHTLELLEEVGLADELILRGQRVDRVVLHHEHDAPIELDLAATGGPFPFVLVLPQTLLEAALARKLAERGIDVAWKHQALTVEEEGDSVRALICSVPESDDREMPTTHLRSDYLVGADGYDSLVRRMLGIEYTRVGPLATFGLIEFETELSAPDELHINLHEGSTEVLWPLGPDRARFSLQIDAETTAPDATRLKQLVHERCPWFRDEIGAVDWTTTIGFDHRLAARFGAGRIWLAGDSARLTSPIGVQNMNVGLREGRDLAQRLASILDGQGNERLLRYYNDERRKEWRGLMGLKGDFDAAPTTPDWVLRMPDRVVAALPASRIELNRLLGQIGLRLVWVRRGSDPASA